MDAPLDPTTLQALRMVPGPNGAPLLDQVVGLALASLPEALANLRKHREASEWDPLRRVAHTLKGSSGSFGAKPLSALAKDLEEAAREMDLPRIDPALARVEAEAARVIASLQALQSS